MYRSGCFAPILWCVAIFSILWVLLGLGGCSGIPFDCQYEDTDDHSRKIFCRSTGKAKELALEKEYDEYMQGLQALEELNSDNDT
jgi:hypothetical protein